MTIPASQLAIRFGLEVAALVAIGRFAGGLFAGLPGYVAGWGVPAVVALLWWTFAVPGDPSRSGRAPVPVPGVVRLALETAVFIGGAAALAARHDWLALCLFLAFLVTHYAMTTARLSWLLKQ